MDTVYQVTNPNIPLNSLLMVQETLGINSPKCLTWLQKLEKNNYLHVSSPSLLCSHLLKTLLHQLKAWEAGTLSSLTSIIQESSRIRYTTPAIHQHSIYLFGLSKVNHLFPWSATGPYHHHDSSIFVIINVNIPLSLKPSSFQLFLLLFPLYLLPKFI